MRNHYSASELIKTVYSLIMTKITMPQARLIRRPVYIRGGQSLVGAKGLTTGRYCRFDLDGRKQTLFVGENCEIGDSVHIVALNKVEIGANLLAASKVFISDTNHGSYKGEEISNHDTPPSERKLVKGETYIGKNVWIGENAVILAGSRIGNGCVVGANTIVSKEIPPNSIVVGYNEIVRQY